MSDNSSTTPPLLSHGDETDAVDTLLVADGMKTQMFVRGNGIRRRINGELAAWVINERGGYSEQFPADAPVLERRPHKKHRDVTRLAQM